MENEEYGKRGVWKMRSVKNEDYMENEEFGKSEVWKMRFSFTLPFCSSYQE